MNIKTIIGTLILAIPFVGICHNPAAAQWSSVKGMGTGPNDGCFSFALNGKGYVGGGSNGTHFYEYDTTANAWTLKGNAPGNKKRAFAFSFVVNGKGYVGTGDTTGANNSCSDVWMYDPANNEWTQKSNFPGGQRNAEFSFVINDTAYVGGGNDVSSVLSDFYRYNAATDTWTPLPTLPFGALLFPSTFTINNKGYVATGAGASLAECVSLWQYDPAGGIWTQKADFPGIARQAGFGFTLGNYGYVGAGASGFTDVYKDMWKYSPATNTWSSAPSFPSLYPGWTAAFTIGNNAYIGTGAYFTTTSLFGTDSFKRYRGPALPSAINEISTGNEITVYPNPATDHISLGGAIAADATCTISDFTGKLIKTFTRNHNDLYIGDLVPGVYLFKYISSAGILTKQVIKKE